MIESLTILTRQVLSKYSRFNLLRNKMLLILSPFLLLAVSILLFLLDRKSILLPALALGLALLIPLVVLTVNEVFINVLYKKSYRQDGIPYIKYLFNQNNFEFENNLGDLITTSVLVYDNIQTCFETKDFFYLYVNKNYAYIVDKSGFKQGNASELSELLKFKVKKFKKVK